MSLNGCHSILENFGEHLHVVVMYLIGLFLSFKNRRIRADIFVKCSIGFGLLLIGVIANSFFKYYSEIHANMLVGKSAFWVTAVVNVMSGVSFVSTILGWVFIIIVINSAFNRNL